VRRYILQAAAAAAGVLLVGGIVVVAMVGVFGALLPRRAKSGSEEGR
jgi:hypothetical protein